MPNSMQIYYAVDDGYYAAKSEEDFIKGYTDLVGEADAPTYLEGFHLVSKEEADIIMLDDVDENERLTGERYSLTEALNRHVKRHGPIFYVIACENC